MYTVMYSVCKHKGPINGTQRINIQGQNVHTKDQSYGPMGTQCMYKRTILATRGTYVCKGPTLWGLDTQIEDQSYEHMMHVQSSNPMGR